MIRIQIDTDNAAFEGDNCGAEVARILQALARRIDTYSADDFKPGDVTLLRDVNGNTVGRLEIRS